MEPIPNIAIYMRLSKEAGTDGLPKESNRKEVGSACPPNESNRKEAGSACPPKESNRKEAGSACLPKESNRKEAGSACPPNESNRKENDAKGENKKIAADMVTLKESNSIRTQRQLLLGYLDSHFTEYRIIEFQDDGYSGTNLAEVWQRYFEADLSQAVLHIWPEPLGASRPGAKVSGDFSPWRL